MDARPDLSVIVVTYNGRELALTTLRSARSAVDSIEVEWLVVDSGSSDGTPDAIEVEFPDVRVFRRDNRGFAAGNNVALGEARGRYLLLLNPDVEIRSGTFDDLVSTMDARPELGLASVIQRDTAGGLQASIRRFPSPSRALGEALFAAHWPVFRQAQELELSDERYAGEGEVEWLVGAFLIARREAADTVGPMDERFFLYSEEVDWCYRFWRAGWPVSHLPTMTITHHGGGRSRGDLIPQLSHSRLLFAGKHYRAARRAGIRAGLALGHAIRIAVYGVASLARSAGAPERVRAEGAGLSVTLGLSGPPLGPFADSRPAADDPPAPRAGARSTTATGASFDPRHYLEERYQGGDSGRSLPLAAYYAAKPHLPRRLQIGLRRLYSKRQARREFPSWPIEPLLVEQERARLRRMLDSRDAQRLPTVANWPDGRRFAAVLTHDVEGPLGVANVRRVIEIEQRHGFASCWNFVAEWYPIPGDLFDHVRGTGNEIGLHGVKHDGRLFETRERFERELPKIRRYLEEWDVVGFRSPATHRNPDWMPELGALYDSSFPDTDPFEPQSGGCCSILPYFLGELVELPITLVQDHTLWEILGRDTIDLWTEKSDWIVANGGLINLITHPDYLDTAPRLRMYEEFLEYLASQREGWCALPREVAAWWRIRDRLRCVEDGDGARIVGEGAERATIAWAEAGTGDVRLQVEPASI